MAYELLLPSLDDLQSHILAQCPLAYLACFVLRLLFRIYVDQCNKLNEKRLARMDRSQEGTVNLTLGSPLSPLADNGMAAKFRSLFNSLEIYPLPRPPSKGTFGPSTPPLKRLWRRISALALSLARSPTRFMLGRRRTMSSFHAGSLACRAHAPHACQATLRSNGRFALALGRGVGCAAVVAAG